MDWRGNEYIDWWDNEEIDLRKALIDKHGTQGLYYWEKTKAGTRTTAELLWNHRDDPEGMALTWIAASMWDKSKDLPEHWRGESYRRIALLLGESINLLKQKGQFT
ncbi:hypothetical protein [Ferdinandcohnia sp. SAFN-114]|uniref:hypothetical protein n=1 Tax=Ferdinandcohnia sp. SAFN-114 TaxID=3387275 RepID=UPI003F7D9A95